MIVSGGGNGGSSISGSVEGMTMENVVEVGAVVDVRLSCCCCCCCCCCCGVRESMRAMR